MTRRMEPPFRPRLNVGYPEYTTTFSREETSAAPARRLVRVALAAWAMPDLVDDGQVVASELVANAVRHARGETIRVTVTQVRPGRVRVAVVDLSHALPCRREPSPDDPRGRGLVLVEALAVAWGWDSMHWGKRVWAELEGARRPHRRDCLTT